MKQSRIQAYVKLIEALVSCAEGEEMALLEQNRALVDAELVRVMEKLATQAEGEGRQKLAKQLRYYAFSLIQTRFLASAEVMTSENMAETLDREAEERRHQAYVNLIETLLAHSRGEAPQILAENAELLDGEFVLTLEQKAQQLQEVGEENQAAFLGNVAQQLAAFLNRQTPGGGGESRETQGNATEEDYFRFLMEVLQTTSQSQGNSSVVYPLLQQNLDKLDGNFAQIMQAWATQTLGEVEEDRAVGIAAVISELADLMQQFPLGSRADNLETGIVGYEISLTVFTPEKLPEMWARLQYNLGNAYSDRIRGERGENLERAIACYEAALQVYTPEAFPQEWAGTQNNLGNAYSDRIRGEQDENLERAIACYQAALQVRTPKAFPEKWADTQNNLGNAYNQRIRGERGENLERAIACYQAALEVYTPNTFPEKWAMTQNNLGTAYLYRIQGEQDENLERAIACYQAALQVYTPEAFPQDNAGTLFNLGLAYRDASQLQKAYDTFAEAIDTVEFIRSGIIEGGEADKQKLAQEWNKLYVNMVEVCLELENYAAALEYAERSKARNLVELLAATRLKPEGVSPEVWERYQALYQAWWNLQQQRDGSPSPTPGNGSSNGDTRSIGVSSSTPATATAEISHRLTQLRQDIDTLIDTEIVPHDPKFLLGQEVQPIRYAEIQALVDDTTAIVEWYFTNKGIHAFIVTSQGQQPIPVSTPSDAVAALAALTDEYKNDYLQEDDTHWQQQLPAYLQRLAEILELDTLLSHIPPQCQQLVLVPYRYLHLFPLHALPVGSPLAPLEKGGRRNHLSQRQIPPRDSLCPQQSDFAAIFIGRFKPPLPNAIGQGGIQPILIAR